MFEIFRRSSILFIISFGKQDAYRRRSKFFGRIPRASER